jgi:hypothetical protein
MAQIKDQRWCRDETEHSSVPTYHVPFLSLEIPMWSPICHRGVCLKPWLRQQVLIRGGCFLPPVYFLFYRGILECGLIAMNLNRRKNRIESQLSKTYTGGLESGKYQYHIPSAVRMRSTGQVGQRPLSELSMEGAWPCGCKGASRGPRPNLSLCLEGCGLLCGQSTGVRDSRGLRLKSRRPKGSASSCA